MASGEGRNVTVEAAPDDVLPKCPACSQELGTIWLKTKGLGVIEQKQIALCPHCHVMLGYGSVKLYG